MRVGTKTGTHLNTKEWDSELELYYLYKRWYSSRHGRFLERSIYPPNIEATYFAFNNNPVTYVDPWGLLSSATAGVAKPTSTPTPRPTSTPTGPILPTFPFPTAGSCLKEACCASRTDGSSPLHDFCTQLSNCLVLTLPGGVAGSQPTIMRQCQAALRAVGAGADLPDRCARMGM